VFDDSLGGNFGLYRNGWLPIGLTDAAAFQQVLSMFVVHLRALYGRGMGFPIVESLSYHTQAITSVRERLSNPAFVVTDGIIGAIIGFACHAVRHPKTLNAGATDYVQLSISLRNSNNGMYICGL